VADNKVDTAALLARVDIVDVIDRYVPLKKSGAEYEACCPFHADASPSFKVNREKQFYHCFGCGANGDAIGFLMAHRGLDFKAACGELGADVPDNAPNAASAPARLGDKAAAEHKRTTPWQACAAVPDDAPEPFAAHSVRGRPSMRWQYQRDGNVLGWVYRFETSSGGKVVMPLVWATNTDTGVQDWHWLAMATPRPLYLPAGTLRSDVPVLVVEGEKCADAAQADVLIAARYDVVSWPGGGKAVSKADWSWIAGRRVVIWPDADAQKGKDGVLLPESRQPGTQAAEAIARVLLDLGCQVRIVAIAPPGEKPAGWDVADAIADGITGEALLALIRVQRAPAGSAPETAPAQPASRNAPTRDADWREQLIVSDKGVPRDCRENVIYVLRDHPEWAGTLAIDTFASRIVCVRDTPLGHKTGDEWRPDDESALALWLSEREYLTVRSLDTVSQSVRHVALLKQMHPVQDYFSSLEWDGRQRVRRWAVDFMDCADNEYSRLVGFFFLLNVVRRIYEPGCVMRSLPVFEGAQNKGKSRALWTLANPWYADTMLRIGDKDAYQLLQGMMIYEISEMDSFSRAEASAVKAFISSTEDRFRAPYERSPTTHRRQTSFAATTNAAEYLKDWTGNTRFWPLAIGDFIDLEGLALARDQLWAETVHWYRQGERAFPTQEQERELFKPEQDKRMIVHPWQEMVADYVMGTTRTVTTREIMQDALKIDLSRVNPQGSEAQRVGQILNGLGYTKAQSRVVGRREWVWQPPQVVTEGSNDVAI
jgi:predicted P-loop ATPase